jgi:hypothetical protein
VYTAAGAHETIDAFSDPLGWLDGSHNNKDIFQDLERSVAGVEGKVSVVIDSVSSLLSVAGQGGIQAVSSKLRRLASSIKVPSPLSPPFSPLSHIDGNHPLPPHIPPGAKRVHHVGSSPRRGVPEGLFLPCLHVQLHCQDSSSRRLSPLGNAIENPHSFSPRKLPPIASLVAFPRANRPSPPRYRFTHPVGVTTTRNHPGNTITSSLWRRISLSRCPVVRIP